MSRYTEVSRQYMRDWRDLNPEEWKAIAHRAYVKSRDGVLTKLQIQYREDRAWLDEIKSQPCMDCHGTFLPCAMEFDHVRGKKKCAVSSMIGKQHRRETILAEITKCDLVCANCHRVRTWKSGRPIRINPRKD